MRTQGITKNTVAAAILVEKIFAGQFQKPGTETAQLRQVLTTTSEYPSARVSNDLQDNLFDESDFGFTSKTYQSIENRVAFINVPVGTAVSVVEELLTKNEEACIYKILDNRPILTEDQNYAVRTGLRSMEEFAASQVVRYPEGHEMAGQIVLDSNDKVQYRAVFFSKTKADDIDNRKADADYGFVSDDIKAELEAISKDATLVKEQGL